MGSLVTQKATGEVRWTNDQASIIKDRDGYDTSKWDNVAPNRNRGVTSASLAQRWNTVDGDGNLVINYYNKVGTGHRQNAAEKTFINEALSNLSSWSNNCVTFKEYTGCDAWMSVDCLPKDSNGDALSNYVEMSCAPEGHFDDGCWSELGMTSGATHMSLESASCSNDNTHCFTRYNGQGRVHQQFLHALGIVGEHQRPDAANYITVQSENIDLSSAQIEQRFSPITLLDWENTAAFDWQSVTMYGFYDFNKESLDTLTASWNHEEYSMVNANAPTSPVWPNRYRASTLDVIQLMKMYEDFPNCKSSLDLDSCHDGSPVFSDRICDGILNDCADGSDETADCVNIPALAQDYCCQSIKIEFSLSFIFAGLSESVVLDSATWDDSMKRPSYKSDISTSLANTYTLLGGQYSFVFWTPIEAQTNAADCGSSSYITWVLYYGATASDVITCETYADVKNGLNPNMYFLDEAVDAMSDPSYCPLLIADSYFSHFDITTGSERQFTCMDDQTVVVTTPTTTTTQPPTTQPPTTQPATTTTKNNNQNVLPCDNSPCGENYECTEEASAENGYSCDCATGYTQACDIVNPTDCSCTNINECLLVQTDCDSAANEECQDTDGSYECVCMSGYELDGAACVDIDECVTAANTCGQECQNTDGSFICDCADGYVDDDGKCVDLDECVNEADNDCTAEHPCKNMIGSFTCTCDSGYEWSNGACIDINECETGECSSASVCVNSVGAYECSCSTGFDDMNGDGKKCMWTNYPDGWGWFPSYDVNHQIWISGKELDTPFTTSFFNVYSALGERDLSLLLCEDYFSIPFGVLVPGMTYVCDDAVQRLTHQRYSNQNRQCCTYKDYVVTCDAGCAAGSYQFIARSKNADACQWDTDSIGTYDWTSNDGNVYDTALCQMDEKPTADEAAAICASRGARLFNEEVYLFNPESFFAAPNYGGCNSVIEMYSKAHGRLYQIPKISPGYNGRILTGYRANAAGDNWCWFDGTTCHDTQTNTPIGVYIEAQTGWLPLAGEPDCSVGMIATAINNALGGEIANIPMTPAAVDDCLAFDLATKDMVTVKCDQGTYDAFVCEREHWDCAADSQCSHECNEGGYCTCPDGMFLVDFFTCSAEPSLEIIECYNTHMVAWFPVADVNYAETLTLNDETCTDNIAVIGNMYRIEVNLDECGTTVEYANGYKEIIFKNTFSSDIDLSGTINIQTRITNTFECRYNAIITVDDVNGAGHVDCDETDPNVDCNDPGEPGTIDVDVERSEMDKHNVGTFSFEILTYASDAFHLALAAGNSRVGETLHYAVVPVSILSNLVYQTTMCKIKDPSTNATYTLFQDETADVFVTPVRYRPYYAAPVSGETCGVENQDKFSYTVFEFLGANGNGASGDGQEQVIECSVMVCIKEDDMTDSPCAPTSCSYWDDASQTGMASSRRRRSPEGITLDSNTNIIFGA